MKIEAMFTDQGSSHFLGSGDKMCVTPWTTASRKKVMSPAVHHGLVSTNHMCATRRGANRREKKLEAVWGRKNQMFLYRVDDEPQKACIFKELFYHVEPYWLGMNAIARLNNDTMWDFTCMMNTSERSPVAMDNPTRWQNLHRRTSTH